MEEIDLKSRHFDKKDKSKIITVYLDALRENVLCPIHKSEVTLDDDLANFEKLCTLFVGSICIRQSQIQLTVSSVTDS